MKTIGKLFKDWETKDTRNAAKASGISMMALSLAACGGGGSAPAPVVVVEVVPITSALAILKHTGAGPTGDRRLCSTGNAPLQVHNSRDSN